jgi:hypothetical protein
LSLRHPGPSPLQASPWADPTHALDAAIRNQAGHLLMSHASNQLQIEPIQASPSTSQLYSQATHNIPSPLGFRSPFDLPSPFIAPTYPLFSKPQRPSKHIHFPVGKGLTEDIQEHDEREPPVKRTTTSEKGKGRKRETSKQSPLGLTEDIQKDDKREPPVTRPIAAEKGKGGKGETAKRGSRLTKQVHFSPMPGELDEDEQRQ